ncbi:MAG: GNAT family N-acetyltransferase [Candidatus Paceibacterota bacterium]
MNIRLLTKRDVAAAAAIVGRNYSKEYEKSSTLEIQSMFGDSAVSPVYYGAEEGGQLVGFAGYIQSWMDYYIYQIFWVNVLPEFQGRGIGKKLVATLIDEIRKDKKAALIQITVTPENIDFYKKHFDFKIIEPFGEPTEYLMSLNLGKSSSHQ